MLVNIVNVDLCYLTVSLPPGCLYANLFLYGTSLALCTQAFETLHIMIENGCDDAKRCFLPLAYRQEC